MQQKSFSRVRVVPHLRAPAAYNLAVEHALFESAKKQLKATGECTPIVRTYEFSSHSVVLGYDQPIAEIDAGYCRDNDIAVTMRQTGGGSVFLNPSDVQYAYIIPQRYTHELLGSVNERLRTGLLFSGASCVLRTIHDQSVLRVARPERDKSFVFDAQRRTMVFYNGETKHLVWHHGTILVSRDGYKHMPRALKATPQEVRIINEGNFWVSQHALARSALVAGVEKHLPFSLDGAFVQPLTQAEKRRAQELYDAFYNNPKAFSDGKKSYGICYLPDHEELPENDYDMERYVVTE